MVRCDYGEIRTAMMGVPRPKSGVSKDEPWLPGGSRRCRDTGIKAEGIKTLGAWFAGCLATLMARLPTYHARLPTTCARFYQD